MRRLLPLLAVMLAAGASLAERQLADKGNALVFGGTGRLGAPIVRLLVEAGHPVTVFARASSDRGRLAGLEVDYLTGDLLDGDSVVAAVAGRPFAYVVDASSRGSSDDPFYATAMRNVLAAVADSGVRQFILHGSVGAGDNAKNFPDVPFGRMRIVLQAKGEAEDLLLASGIPYTIIRNGRVERDGTPPTGNARLLEDYAILAPVTRPDLAALTLECVGNPDCVDKTLVAVDDSL
jgi:uncharacterized protein YbjT (DUF2867 family)